ncbi:MAG TPA: hypothetical protein VM120_25955 [Bryobacteraceae bacterium]|nr:hypothetical protein [Bryobacteraceae bacterium]
MCYFPSSARLGLDNDNIVIASSVYDDNVPLAVRGHALTNGANAEAAVANPASAKQAAIRAAISQFPAWQGTRTRVVKKAALYTGTTSMTGVSGSCGTSVWLCPGASQMSPQLQGDFYDLFVPSTAFTFDILIARTLPAGIPQSVTGLHYEPEHVRGRSLASFNGNGNLDGQYSSLWGAVDQGYFANPETLLYHRPITYTRTVAGTIGANVSATPAVGNVPSIVGGIPSLGALQSHTVPQFSTADSVIQRDKLPQPSPNNQLSTPWLYVGDDRPHRVISREGHRYIARVGSVDGFRFDVPVVGTNPAESGNYSTVIYDIVQKLTPTAPALEIYNTHWANGLFYAPMFDTPANVVQYGSLSPVNVQPFLEKLFVGTVGAFGGSRFGGVPCLILGAFREITRVSFWVRSVVLPTLTASPS